MIRIAVWPQDLSETYLQQVAQLGADCIDFGAVDPFVGSENRITLAKIDEIRNKLGKWGLSINRVTLPTIERAYLIGESEDTSSVDAACDALEVYAQAGLPLVRQRLGADIMPGQTHQYRAVNRAGYTSRGEYAHWASYTPIAQENHELLWQRFLNVFERLSVIADHHTIKLAVHPSDTPYPGTLFDSLGFHRVVDAFPSKNIGFLYCIGTRAEAGGSSLVLDEINSYGRKGRIFAVHFRNVRGSLATAGGFEEVLLDDGDMNMARILNELKRVGFDGCVNPDHVPVLHDDTHPTSLGLAYSIGYIKALLAANYA